MKKLILFVLLFGFSRLNAADGVVPVVSTISVTATAGGLVCVFTTPALPQINISCKHTSGAAMNSLFYTGVIASGGNITIPNGTNNPDIITWSFSTSASCVSGTPCHVNYSITANSTSGSGTF